MKIKYLFGIGIICYITIGCKSLQPTINDFKSSPVSVELGESSQLQWDIKSAKKCNISISSVGTELPATDNKNINPEKTTEYLLKVEKDGVVLVEKKVTVEVKMPDITKFEASPTAINEGEKTTLSWEVINAKNCAISLKNIEDNIPLVGSKEILVNELPKEYILSVSINDKEVTQESVKISVVDKASVNSKSSSGNKIKTKIKNNIEISEGPDDGRFSIGGNGKRLMYGYPISKSTSHFVVNVDGIEASNTPSHKEKINYLTGEETTLGEKGSVHKEIVFIFNGVKIIQRLTPVNKDLKEVKLNEFGQFYKISYEIINTTTASKKVSLFVLFDIMIDDNDAAQMNINTNVLANEKVLYGDNIPENITFYNSNRSLSGECIIKTDNSINPDALYIGRWSYFYSVINTIDPNNSKYGDSGFIIKWENKEIKANDSIILYTVYGIHGKGNVEAVSSTKLIESNETIYFEHNKNLLSDIEKEKINKLIDNIKKQQVNIEGAMISGFSDAKGPNDINMKLSKNRIAEVSSYLKTKGIKKSFIIPKAYGEEDSNQTEECQQNGNNSDRKCEIVIYGSKTTK